MFITFDHVLDVFLDYLSEDENFDVMRICQGYLCLAFDERRDSWYVVRLCANPRALRETLLESYEKYQRYTIGQNPDGSHRMLTVEEEIDLQAQLKTLSAECGT